MNFAPFNSHTNDLFLNNKLLKLDDIIKVEKLKIIFDFNHNALPDDLLNLFISNSNVHNHATRNVCNDGLFVPAINTTSFGNNSLRFSAPVVWNNHLKINKDINNMKTKNQFKTYLKNYFLSQYNC